MTSNSEKGFPPMFVRLARANRMEAGFLNDIEE
jgi:hypothetical protein